MTAIPGTGVVVVGDGVAGHYAAWLLAGLGADVTVLTSPDRVNLAPLSQWLTAGTTCRQAAPGPLDAYAAGHDAMVIDAGELLPVGLPAEVEALAAAHPQLVAAVVSPFGLHGPLAHHRATHHEVQAAGGLLGATGDVDAPPVPVGGHVTEMATGANAALAVLLGLWRRRNGGPGALIDVSAHETTVGLQCSRLLTYAQSGLVHRRTKADSLINFVPCKDGFVNIYLSYTPLDEFLRFLEVDESDVPPVLLSIRDKGEQFAHPELLAITKRALRDRTRAELVERGVWWRIPVTPALSPADIVTDEHMAARRYFAPSSVGGQEVMAPQYPFKGPIWRPARVAAGRDAPATPRDSAPERSLLPLAGIRAAEFSLGWAAPMTGAILAMYGAEVVKVESPTRLDTARVLPLLDCELRQPWWEYSSNYHPVHCGKLHFGLDIKGPHGRDALQRLVRATDLVVTNFSVRALRDLGLDGAALQAVNPRCSVVNATGYGADGPYHAQGSYGSGMEGVTGLAWASGGPAGLIRSQLLHPDIFTALHAALALVASLFWRERTGRGAAIDLSQFELGSLVVTAKMLAAQGCPEPETLRLRLRAQGDDQWVAVTVASAGEWHTLTTELGRPDSAWSFAAACANPGGAAEWLAEATAAATKGTLAARLRALGLAAEPVLRYDETTLLPHLARRNYFVRSENAAFGRRIHVGRWHHFRDSDIAQLDGVHRFGQDNADVLTRVLGYTADEAEVIAAEGTTGTGPHDRPSPGAASSPIDWMLATRVIYEWDDGFRARLGLD